MLVIGLTGGIGSGKSVVAKRFAALGVPVIDADVIARELVEPGQAALDEIIDTFGAGYLNADGTLNRAALRDHVFANPRARTRLEAILHPRIRTVMTNRIRKLTAPYCILVIPLLVETGQSDLVDRVLVVDSTEAEQRARIARRDHLTDAEITSILDTQADRARRLAAADDIIDNTAGQDRLDPQIRALHGHYQSLGDRGRKPPPRH